MSAVMYQTMPPLSPDEYAQLEQSILADGIQVPIIVDEYGVVIDGHHRKAIAEQHNLHLPREVRQMLTEAQKKSLSISLNIARRQLSREQKRAIIEDALRAQPEQSNRQHARELGADHKTIGAARDRLESTGDIPQFDKTTGADGKERPASYKRTETFKEEFTEEIDGMTVDPRTGEVFDNEEFMRSTLQEAEDTQGLVKLTGPGSVSSPGTKPSEPKPVATGAEADRLNAVQTSKAIGSALETLLGLTFEGYRSGILNEWWPIGKNDVPPAQSDLFTPSQLRHIAQGLITTANEMEAHRV